MESSPATIGGTGTRQAHWERYLTHWTEVIQPFPTHYNKYGNTCNKLDRAFVPYPSSMLLKLSVTLSVIGTPEQVSADGESDHAPVALGFGRHIKAKVAESPFPRWVTKHPNFKVHLKSLTDYIGILTLDVSEQLLSYKSCMREAARRVRNESRFLNPDGSAEGKIALSSISRALWFNDLPLARKLLRWSSIAKDPIYIEEYKVLAFPYENFEQIFGDFHNVFHRSEVNQLQNEIAATESLIVKKQFQAGSLHVQQQQQQQQQQLCRLTDKCIAHGLVNQCATQGRWADLHRLSDLSDKVASHDWLWAVDPHKGKPLEADDYVEAVRLR